MQVPVEIESGEAVAPSSDELVGRSMHMQEVFKAIGRVAPQDVTVLIHGESGTGKELVARAIYHHSRRADKHFLAVNCAAIPERCWRASCSAMKRDRSPAPIIVASASSSNVPGVRSFWTKSAICRRSCKARCCASARTALERVGGGETIKTDVRIIAATNRDLKQMATDGQFREDLYYRLNGFTIKLPPLRERGEDVELLIQRFLQRFSKEIGKSVRGLSPDATEILNRYPWPGNVRELQAVLRQALLQTTGPLILPEFLPDDVRYYEDKAQRSPAQSGMPTSNLQTFVDDQLQNARTISMPRRLPWSTVTCWPVF